MFEISLFHGKEKKRSTIKTVSKIKCIQYLRYDLRKEIRQLIENFNAFVPFKEQIDESNCKGHKK